jgi:uncharacterized phage-associated protein
MIISSSDAAKKICELGDWKITNLKLQKILYLIHLVSLGRRGVPLINEYFEAWDFGPVEPELYHAVKFFGSDFIKLVPRSKNLIDKESSDLIEEVFEVLKNKTATQLVQLTHRKNGAWYKAYSINKKGIKINNNDILNEYEQFSKKQS